MTISESSPGRRAFAAAVRQPDSQLALARAALLLAGHEYPDLDVEGYLARLDTIAGQVRARVEALPGASGGATALAPAAAPARAIIAALNDVLFRDLGFHGNRTDYHDPRNSFLNEVLDRRTGISITLALVYMEVAARVGLRLLGVGMPGHFILQYPGAHPAPDRGGARPGAGEIFIDPYHAGALLSRADCATYFRRLYGPDFTFSEEYLTPLTRRQILARLLNNLKAIYLGRRDYRRALVVVDRLLLVQPEAMWELKDRGLLYYRVGAFRAALDDLRQYLKQDPDAEDAALIRYYINLCQRTLMIAN